LVRPADRSSNPIVHARLTLLVLGEDERQNSCDDKPGERALNLIQIKDVKLECIPDGKSVDGNSD